MFSKVTVIMIKLFAAGYNSITLQQGTLELARVALKGLKLYSYSKKFPQKIPPLLYEYSSDI